MDRTALTEEDKTHDTTVTEYFRLIFTSLVLLIYLAALIYVICKVGFKRFDGKVYLSIFGFLVGMGLSVALCSTQIFSGIKLETWQIVHLPQKVEDFVIVSVLYRFIYEMRSVWLKITCDDLQSYS